MMIADALNGAQELSIRNGSIWLLPEGGVFEPQTNTLLVADIHLGKADRFRHLGVPVPNGPNQESLRRLSGLLEKYQPEQLIFLGDLVHDRLPAQHPVYDGLAEWRHQFSAIRVTLVLGNHDLKAGTLPAYCGIQSVSPGSVAGPLRLLHEPDLPTHGSDLHAVAGHIHPVVRLSSCGDSVRTRCFWARPGLTILPAFGEFTGGYQITANVGDLVYVPDEHTVHRLPRLAAA